MISDLSLWLCNFLINKIPFHFIRSLYYKKVMRFSMEKGASIHLGCVFNCRKNLYLGANSTINQFCRIDNRGGIFIGQNVSISPYVKLITADHDLFDSSFPGRESPIRIEDYCFLGSDSMVLPGCEMKRGSSLGAKALLTQNTEADFLYQGVPAIKSRKRPSVYTYSTTYERWFH